MRNPSSRAKTRREFIGAGAGVALGGLLAGCAGRGSTDTEPTASEQTSGGETTARETADSDSPYSVTMSPVGTVEFDAVPERLFVVFPHYADMAVALGRGDDVNSLYVPEMSGKTMNTFYDRLDGVSFDWKGLPDPLNDGPSKEFLYELNSDVHFVDPAYVSTLSGWDEADIQEIAETLGPWFGNYYSGQHGQPPEPYGEDYRYYTLWELFEKVATALGERGRYEALAGMHADAMATVRAKLPPKEERPTVTRVSLFDETFYAYHVNDPGYWQADIRPLGAIDAFAGQEWPGTWGKLDYEAMLEADPDVIINLWGISPGYYIDEIRETVASHPVGKKLSAIQNGRFYAGGMRFQGPIMNLFQLEMTAKQLYPEQFGEWPGYVAGEPYPEIPEGERLFDRERLASIVTGDW